MYPLTNNCYYFHVKVRTEILMGYQLKTFRDISLCYSAYD